MGINTQLAVIGAGPGGYPAAFKAADLGLKVTLIDREKYPGGECLYRGCIPSKALLHVANILSEAKRAKEIGITYNSPNIDLEKVVKWKNQIIDKLTKGTDFLAKQRKINYIRGNAFFVNSRTIKVTREDGSEEVINFENCIIATGSRPTGIPGIEVDNKEILDSKGALEIETIPQELLVIGGGYIGLEMGTVYSALGSNVTVVEMLDSLITSVDKDMSNVLYKQLKKEFSAIFLGTKVVAVKKVKQGLTVTFENDKDGKFERIFDKILVSTGRKPNSESIGLENTNVKINNLGFIETDRQRRTTEPNIYAIGDVAGEPMLAHKATHEGRVAAQVIAGQDVIYDVSAVPAVIFTDPEIAWCGLTEKEAQKNSIDVKITEFPWRASGRAMTLDRTDGLTKMIFDSKTERLLGVGIVGPGAGELISEAILGIEMATLASDISMSVHPHPTISETFMEAAEIFHAQHTLYKVVYKNSRGTIMEILISMKADDMNRTKFRNLQMDMPTAQVNGYFVAEIRDSDDKIINMLKKYGDILLKKLNKNGNFALEYTEIGFKLKKQVDNEKNYMEEWEEWVVFSRELYEELKAFFENEEGD